jgi:DNA-binding Lrp family transcriptional regulator
MARAVGELIIDETDRRLIALLRANSRTGAAVLAKTLGVSRGTVQNRLRKLEQAGVIRRYTIELGNEAPDTELRAWMSLRMDANQSRRVIAQLMGEPAVRALHDTNGRWDLLADLAAPSLSELSAALERIRTIKGVQASETSLHLATFR